jgi:hypothetical protein
MIWQTSEPVQGLEGCFLFLLEKTGVCTGLEFAVCGDVTSGRETWRVGLREGILSLRYEKNSMGCVCVIWMLDGLGKGSRA